MSEYRLQTEISDETRSEMALHSQTELLRTEVQIQKEKISKRLSNSAKVFSFLILVNVLLSFAWQQPADFFVVIVYGIAYAVEIVWLTFGWRKRQRKLEEWQRVAGETAIQNYKNQ